MELKIACGGVISPEELVKKWGEERLEIKGTCYVNKQTGIIGFFVSPVLKPGEMLDVFIDTKEIDVNFNPSYPLVHNDPQ